MASLKTTTCTNASPLYATTTIKLQGSLPMPISQRHIMAHNFKTAAHLLRPVSKLQQPKNMIANVKPCHAVFDSKSEPPPVFNGETRLYYSSRCPYAQRVWIARNYKGLHEIKLVEISLSDKPTWYKENVYPPGKVPALEHNGKVIGESMDLLEYLEYRFDGARIFPLDECKKETVRELLNYTDSFNKAGYTALSMKGSNVAAAEKAFGPALDYVEKSLGKFSHDGPFFLGTFGVVDIAYAPFIERLHLGLSDFCNYNITAGRPNLRKWIEALNQVEAYAQTKMDSVELHALYKKMLDENYFSRIGLASAETKAGQAAAK